MAPTSSRSSGSGGRSRPPSSRSRRGPNSVRTSSTIDEPAKKRCFCCSVPFLLFMFLLAVIAGGILLWQFLPDDQKDRVRESIPGNGNGTANSVGNGGFSLFGDGEPPAATFPYLTLCKDAAACCNGLVEICDLPVNKILFGALHNAGATVEDGFLVAGNHEYQLEDALDYGFRGINLDVGICEDTLKIVHGNCRVGHRDPTEVFQHLYNFLQENPREVILMPIEFATIEDVTPRIGQVYDAMYRVGLTEYMYDQTPNQRDSWPTLSEMITMDKRLIAFFYGPGVPNCNQVECPRGFQEWWRYTIETPFEFETVDDVSNTPYSCSRDRGEGGLEDFYALNLFVSDPLPSKKSAQIINTKDFLDNRIQACKDFSGLDPNVLFIDFWSEGDVIEVVQTENLKRGEAYIQTQQQQQEQQTQENGQRQLRSR